MGVTATLAGHRATHARVQIPGRGIWYVEASLDGEHTIAAGTQVEAKLADLTLAGTVLSGGPRKGRSTFRVIGGRGGWHRTVPRKSYANDAGTKAAKVIGDAATEVGEVFSDTSTSSAGPGFTRPEDRASVVLEQLAPNGWYVDETGRTRLGRRASAKLPAKATLLEPVDMARGVAKIASDSIATILPGVLVGELEASDVEHVLSPEVGLRTTIWGVRGVERESRDMAALRAAVEALDPFRKFRGVTEYRVVTREGKRLNLQPVLTSLGMPDLPRVKVRPGVAGMETIVPLGSVVLVAFVNSDPGRPYVCGFEDPEGAGFGSGAEFVARIGDAVSVTISSAALTAAGGSNGAGAVAFASSASGTGTITSGSATVKAVD